MTMINIALPKGRLGEKAYGMFEAAGFECPSIKEENRKLIFENPEVGVRYFWVKPSDVVIYVERGAADIGIAGKDIILEIEVCGALNVRSLMPDAMLIFIDAPSLEELERRLIGRGSETPESIKSRIDRAREELKLKDNYDRIVVNNDLQTAILEIENIIIKGE
jgi:guanylate kinase